MIDPSTGMVREIKAGDVVDWYDGKGLRNILTVLRVHKTHGIVTGVESQSGKIYDASICRIIVENSKEVLEGKIDMTKSPDCTLEEELRKSITWHENTFPGSTKDELERKLREELIELHENTGDPSEMADVLIVMAAVANRYGYDLATEVRTKMEVNRSRKRDKLGNRLDKPKSDRVFCNNPEGISIRQQIDIDTIEEAKRIPDYQIEKMKKPEHTLDILDEARNLVQGDRREDYGPLTPSFQRIAKMWSGVFNQEVTPVQVALAMVLLKACRASQGYKRDSLVDMAGYTYIMQRLQEELGESSE